MTGPGKKIPQCFSKYIGRGLNQQGGFAGEACACAAPETKKAARRRPAGSVVERLVFREVAVVTRNPLFGNPVAVNCFPAFALSVAGVVGQPDSGVFQFVAAFVGARTVPVPVGAGQLDFLFVLREDLIEDDPVEFAVREVIGVVEDDMLLVEFARQIVQKAGKEFVADRLRRGEGELFPVEPLIDGENRGFFPFEHRREILVLLLERPAARVDTGQ